MDLLVFILGAATAQGVFLVVALAVMTVRDTQSRWLLTGLIAVLTITLGEEFLDVAGAPRGTSVGLVADFAAAPLIYLLMRTLTATRRAPLRRSWPHFLPFAGGVVWLLALNVLPEQRWVSLSNPAIRDWIALTVAIKFTYTYVYLWMAWRTSAGALTGSAQRTRAVTWIRRWLLVFGLAYGIAGLSFFAYYFGVPGMIDSDYIGAALLVVVVYSLAYFAMSNRAIFDQAPRQGPEDAHADVVARARSYLAGEGACRNPDLELADLARVLQMPADDVSQALNAELKGGFYALLNACRLEAFSDLAREARNREATSLQLALEAGFRSKATFYRVLKAETGLTPSKYRAGLVGPVS